MTNELFLQEALPQMDALQHFAFNLCRDAQYSRDLVQETMLKAYRAFDSYREGTNCRAWLFQICKNSYINSYRRKQYETIAMDMTADATVPADDEMRENHAVLADYAAIDAQEAMFSDEVIQALNSLPTDYQTALILSDIEGYTYEEIAEFSQTPIGTIRSRIHRGRKMLAECLAEYAAGAGYGASRFSS